MLLTQCTELAKRLEALQARTPAKGLFTISGLSSDRQRVYAVELILMQLRGVRVQKEVAEAIGNLLETISVTYPAQATALVIKGLLAANVRLAILNT